MSIAVIAVASSYVDDIFVNAREGETHNYGYMNVDGKVVIPPRFVSAEMFDERGLAKVCINSGRTEEK